MSIVGRSSEFNKLEDFFEGETAKFMALYGRRRVGKTFLIENYFRKKNCIYFHVTGIKKTALSRQIEAFTQELSRVFYAGVDLQVGRDWFAAFEMLASAINKVAKQKKIVLFFDELPWMATKRSGLISALEYYWNRFWHSDKRIRLVVCGSSASWIIKKIIKNTGGLYQRVTHKMELSPFTLQQTKAYLDSIKCRLNHQQIVELYMVTGGIPLYLSHAKRGYSAAQIIDELCFHRDGFLVGELEDLFSSLFDEADIYIDMMRAIASRRYGITKTELSRKLKISEGGTFNQRLKNLEQCGFVMGFLPYLHRSRGEYYKVVDEYSNFYFKWIEPIKKSVAKLGDSKGYWINQMNSPGFQAWSGLAFESICYKHITQIKKALCLSASALPYGWKYTPKHDQEDGAQIDLLFERGDNAVTLCEIKYSQKPYAITKQYARNIMNKMKVFREKTRTKRQLFMTMITSNGLKSNRYSDELVSSIVTLDDLFAE